MKHLIISIITLITISANAQLFEGGVNFGLIASQIDGDAYGGYHKLGFTINSYAQLNLKKDLGLISGVGYSQKGARSATETSFFSTQLHYVEVPLLLYYKPFDKISFSGGIVSGYLISGRSITIAGTYNEDELDLRKYELSYFFSFNYHLNEKIAVNLSNNYSLVSITKPNHSGNCLSSNMFFFFLNSASNCWWNNNLRLTFQYKIFNN